MLNYQLNNLQKKYLKGKLQMILMNLLVQLTWILMKCILQEKKYEIDYNLLWENYFQVFYFFNKPYMT